MSHFKPGWILFYILLDLILAFFIKLDRYPTYSFVSMVNSLFLASLILLIFGGFLFVLQGGFFDVIIYSFKKFFRSFSKREEWISENEIEEDRQITVKIREKKGQPETHSCLLVGGILFLLSIAVSFLLL